MPDPDPKGPTPEFRPANADLLTLTPAPSAGAPPWAQRAPTQQRAPNARPRSAAAATAAATATAALVTAAEPAAAVPAAAVPAAAVPAAAEPSAEPSAEPAAAALSAAAGGGGGVGMAAAAAAAALSLELGQHVNASDLVVHSSNGMTGWSANERSDGGMGALTNPNPYPNPNPNPNHACARDEDACLHIGARAVRLARTACIYTQQAPEPG